MIINVEEISPDDFQDKLVTLAETYSRVTMNINEYVKLLSVKHSVGDDKYMIDPVIDRDKLKTGHYATVGDMKIFVSKNVTFGEIKAE